MQSEPLKKILEYYGEAVKLYYKGKSTETEVFAIEASAKSLGATARDLALARGGRLSSEYIGAGLWRTIVLEGYQTNA